MGFRKDIRGISIIAILFRFAIDRWDCPSIDQTPNQSRSVPIELNGQIFVIKNVSAQVNEETGEQLLALLTVKPIQRSIMNRRMPDRFTEVPVYDYAA